MRIISIKVRREPKRGLVGVRVPLRVKKEFMRRCRELSIKPSEAVREYINWFNSVNKQELMRIKERVIRERMRE